MPDPFSTDPERTQDAPLTPDTRTVAPPSRQSSLGSTVTHLPEIKGYELTREIARGGMGRVLEGRELLLNREVAVKVLLAGARDDRFVLESKITAQLPHPNIPPVYALGSLDDGSPYLVMKLIHGTTLGEALMNRRQASVSEWLGVFEQICLAVGFAHSKGIIHRDLKPANIMVGEFGEVQVMDWGLAKNLLVVDSEMTLPDNLPSSGDELTVQGSVMGTPSYMAPEQARGETLDHRADVFALGGILCMILTGSPPFTGANTKEILVKAAEGSTQEALQKLDSSGVESELIAIAKRCLQPSPNQRYSNALEVAKAVAGYRTNLEQRLREAERQRAAEEAKAAELRKRRRVQMGLAASVLLLMVAGTFAIVVASLWRTAEGNRENAEKQRDLADIAKGEALVAQGIADEQRKLAEEQKGVADKAKDEALSAKENALTQKGIAEGAKEEALKAKDIAEKAQVREETLRKKIAGIEYGNSMRVAHQELREGNATATKAILAAADPQFKNWEWHFLNRLSDLSQMSINAHTDIVTAASFNKDGSRIVSGSLDKTAKVWDAKTGREILSLKGHTGPVFSASFNHDGTRILTASADGTAKIWDAKTGEVILTFKGHKWLVRWASFNNDGTLAVSASPQGSVKIWDTKTGEEVSSYGDEHFQPKSVSWSLDGSKVLILATLVVQLDWKTKKTTTNIKPEGFSSSACYSPDGTQILVGYAQDAKLYDAKMGTELKVLKGHTGVINSVAFHPKGTQILTSSIDRTAKIWDAKEGTEIQTLKGHTDFVTTAEFHPDGNKVVTAGKDKTIKVWNVGGGAEMLALKGHTAPVIAFCFSPDGTKFATASEDKTAKIWDVKTGAELFTLKHGAIVRSIAFHPDGTKVITGSGDEPFEIIQTEMGPIRIDGKATGLAKIWDVKTGAVIFTFKKHSSDIHVISFNHDGSQVISGSWNSNPKIWNAKTGADIVSLQKKIEFLTSLTFSTDGSLILSTDVDKGAILWDATTGKELHTFKGHIGSISSARFNFDGTKIITAGRDKTVKVWDTKTLAEIFTIKGSSGPFVSAAFSPDGTRIVTASDQNARLWDTQTGAEVLTLKGHTGPVNRVVFSADGKFIATGGADNYVNIWYAGEKKEK